MFFDLFVEKRLGDGGVVDFAVTVAAVSDQVDDHVGAEPVAVFGGETGYANYCVYIFAVDVEDRDRLAARDAGGETGGVLLDIACRESQEIVDDDMNGAAHGVARKVGVVHGFGEDALSGERGVAVNEEREIFFASAFTGAVLFGAGAADGYGIDGFEVTGI